MTPTPASRNRSKALKALSEEMLQGDLSTTDVAELRAVAIRMRSFTSLGRTDRWVSACKFAHDEIEKGSPPDWAVLQGLVWMSHAA